jgi:hypothetical protein
VTWRAAAVLSGGAESASTILPSVGIGSVMLLMAFVIADKNLVHKDNITMSVIISDDKSLVV